MITVLPEGGLCNRMRVVASAWLLAKASAQPMRVLWHRTPDFNARFDSIFSTAEIPFDVLERSAMTRIGRGGFRLREYWARVSGNYVLGECETAPGKFQMEHALKAIDGRDVFVHTNSRLAFDPEMYKLFVPAAEAAEFIENLRANVANSVGVHVRRTDNTQALRESTLEQFIALMKVEVESNPKTQFFLATDDPEVTTTLQANFADRVQEYKKRAYSRNDPLAIVDAVVDLFALGNCRKLIGSYWSSFTDTAAELNGIECVIARSSEN